MWFWRLREKNFKRRWYVLIVLSSMTLRKKTLRVDEKVNPHNIGMFSFNVMWYNNKNRIVNEQCDCIYVS